ncbi:MAG: hypothetical protein C9356_11920 [Oleiphilus sp.]|nr:MAG: hypothetical protein C9356_11920 [Oleiphilus sp.]
MSEIAHTVDDILGMEGIVVRKIPATTTRRWRTIDTARLPDDAKVVERKSGTVTYEETTVNALSGYAVTFEMGQCAHVRFSKRASGFGKTIEAAYEDYLAKNTPSRKTAS